MNFYNLRRVLLHNVIAKLVVLLLHCYRTLVLLHTNFRWSLFISSFLFFFLRWCSCNSNVVFLRFVALHSRFSVVILFCLWHHCITYSCNLLWVSLLTLALDLSSHPRFGSFFSLSLWVSLLSLSLSLSLSPFWCHCILGFAFRALLHCMFM